MLLLDNEIRHAPHHNHNNSHGGGGICSPDGSPGTMEYSSRGEEKACTGQRGGGGFKDFFRKRHKSNSSGNGAIQVRTDLSSERETTSKGGSSPTSGPGTKMRLIGGSSAISTTSGNRQRSQSDAPSPEMLGMSLPASSFAYKVNNYTGTTFARFSCTNSNLFCTQSVFI